MHTNEISSENRSESKHFSKESVYEKEREVSPQNIYGKTNSQNKIYIKQEKTVLIEYTENGNS